MIDLSSYEDIGLERVDPEFVKKVAIECREWPVESIQDKIKVPPSGDLHDYYSWAPYVWIEGGARVRRDGKINPTVNEYDKPKLLNFVNAVKFLVAAFRLTGDVLFAERAKGWICGWMVNPVTLMNPHMRYAQCAPYRGSLSEGGIIEGRRFIWVSRAVHELESHKVFSSDEIKAIRDWFARFLDWLLTSPQGVLERKAPNNHGTWYDALVVSLAKYLGDEKLIREVLRTFPERIASQIGFGCSFPLEEKRADPSHYVKFNLRAVGIVMEVGFLDL
jgi:hypothetical protein